MRPHIRQAMATAVLTCLFVPAVSRLIAQSTLAGVYKTTLAAADLPGAPPDAVEKMAGAWTVTFSPDGTFSVQHGADEHVKGTYTSSGDDFTLTDASGDFACLGAETQGVYRITRSGPSAKFTTVKDDACAGRAAILSAKAFEKVQ